MNNRRNSRIRAGIAAVSGIGILIIVAHALMMAGNPAPPLPAVADRGTPQSGAEFPVTETPLDQAAWIQINPLGNPVRGDMITVFGTTNDPSQHAIQVEVAAPFTAREQIRAGNTVSVVPASGSLNRWSFEFDSTSFNTTGNVLTACIENMTPAVCVSQQFSLREPLQTQVTPAGCWQKIDPVMDHGPNEVFFINGTTNCPEGNWITVEIISHASGNSSRSYINGNVKIRQISRNTQGWSVTIDSSTLGSGQKTVSACGVGICGFQTFTILG